METTKLLKFPNYHFNIQNKIKIPLSLSQAFITYHPNVFILILSLTEGRAGIAWEPSDNKMLFPPPEIKCLTYFPTIFSLLLPFYCPS
jgi:hypothetical protein